MQPVLHILNFLNKNPNMELILIKSHLSIFITKFKYVR